MNNNQVLFLKRSSMTKNDLINLAYSEFGIVADDGKIGKFIDAVLQTANTPIKPISTSPAAAAPDMVSVKKEDANNYCRILTALDMEEEGDPVAEVQRLLATPAPVVLAALAAQAAQSVANADGRFTKNPVTIDAIKWTGSNLREVIAFTDGPPDTRSIHAGMAWEAYVDLVARDGLKIYTLEGKMLANIGDWIIRGIKGEYYPCKPDIFEATYTSAPQAAPQAQADARDAAFEAVRQKFCKLQRYSLFLDDKGNVRRTPDYCGNWVEFEAVHTLFEPGSVDAAIVAAKGNEK